MKKCIIFGASKYGSIAWEMLKPEYDIIGFSDNDQKKWNRTFCGLKIYLPKELPKMEAEIIIASQYYPAIHKQLRSMGIEQIEVFYYYGNMQSIALDGDYKLYKIPDKKIFEDCDYCDYSDYAGSPVYQKKKNGRKILFCAYAFPPIGGAGVQRSLKFVKYLLRLGYEPTVLTVGENDQRFGIDETLLNELEGKCEIIRVDETCFLPEMLSSEEQQEIFDLYYGVVQSKEWMEEYLDILYHSENAWKLIPDNKICWVNQCLKVIENKIDLSEIDFIYTTGDPFSTYFLGYYLSKKFNLKWIMDYRDPWCVNDYYVRVKYKNDSATIKLQRFLERKLIKQADAVITICHPLTMEFVEKYEISKDKAFTITNGYDEDDFKDISVKQEKNSKFTICYNGRLYGAIDPIVVLTVVNKLIDNQKIKPHEIQWIFNGTVEPFWKEKLQSADQYHIVQYNGYLPHAESIKVAMGSDLLAAYGAMDDGAEIIYSGKIFEYLRMHRPIMSFSGKNGILEKLVMETNSGFNFEYSDTEELEAYIYKQFMLWKQQEKTHFINNPNIEKYSRLNTTKQLIKVFENLWLGEECDDEINYDRENK